MKTNKTLLASISILLLLFVTMPYLPKTKANESDTENIVTVFKSQDCDCCVRYIHYLEKQGFRVKAIDTEDTFSIKEKYEIPPSMQSCHTAVIGDYFIEGHVPIEAVKKLLNEKPAVDGIALPGMPPGSPGMPGPQREAFKIYALSDGISSEFMVYEEESPLMMISLLSIVAILASFVLLVRFIKKH